jgi:DNA invertase Pin-like site-specific DNA recombinase
LKSKIYPWSTFIPGIIMEENNIHQKSYVPYLRVSTKGQERSGLGLEAQRAVIEHFAKLDNAKIIKEFVEAESGKDIENRPTLKEAIQFCQKNNFVLVVAKLDRLSRNVEHIFKIQNKLGDLFKSCDLPSTDSLTLSIFAGLAQREREIISIRTKLALKAKKDRGEKLGKPENLTTEGRRLGVEKIKEKAGQNPNNRRAKSLILKCKNEGMTLEKIAEELNQNGFTTARGKAFHKTTVSRLVA